MRRFSLFLFYLLILFLPTQLGRHFFFDFSQISGIRSDYLTPTIYFTDLLALLLIIINSRSFWERTKRGLQNLMAGRFWTNQSDGKNHTLFLLLLVIFLYLLFNVIFIATNKWAAFYKLIKIIEFILLGVVVYRLKPKLSVLTFVFSVGVFYSSIIAIWQFLIQKSIGGIFWWLGERTFYAATPGIAALSYHGNLLLRPYATFPHPNVLGGFLAVILPLIFMQIITLSKAKDSTKFLAIKRAWFAVSLAFGIAALFLSFSRVAWGATILGFAAIFLDKKYSLLKKLKANKERVLFCIYLIMTLSVIVPLLLPKTLFANLRYWQERTDLIRTTVSTISSHPLFGVGLNNSIAQSQSYVDNFSSLYIFQPVHNIYLLIFAETGIAGLFFLLGLLAIIIHHGLKAPTFLFYSLTQLFALGFFDHYLVTLQQGQLLLVIFAALTFATKVAY